MLKSLLNKKSFFQFLRFVIVGFMNTGVDLGVFNLLIWIFKITSGWQIAVINIVAVGIAMTNSYFFNKYWAFKKKETDNRTMEVSLFFIFTMMGLGINTGIVYSLTTFVEPFAGISGVMWANLSKVVAIAVVLFWNFFWYKIVVFRTSSDEVK